MKKLAILLIAAIAMQSCSRSSLGGATTGMWTGATLGGAIGGLMGGHRGHHLGTVVGVIAGAAAGAVAANNAEKRYDEYVENYNSSSRNRSHKNSRRVEDSYNSYDNRESSRDSYNGSSAVVQKSSPLVLRNLRFVDDNGNQTINRNEDCKIIFELSNPTNEALYDVVPAVYEIDGNSHVNLSPSTRIEVVKPGDVVRYTCSLRSDGKIKVGALKFRIAVAYAENDFITLREFSLPTAK